MTKSQSEEKPAELHDAFARLTLEQWTEALQLGGGTVGIGICAALDKCIQMRGSENPWRDHLLDALITAGIYRREHDSDPRRAIHDMIAWEISIALDPMVSSIARELIQRGIDTIKDQDDKLR